MIRLLARLLIKDHKDYSAPRVRGAYGMLSGCVGIALNLLLFTAKFFAGLFAKAISLQADAFNNLGDAGSSLIALFGFRLASKKPDRDHPYGHGRFEYIAGLFVSVAILLMGFSLFRSSLSSLISGDEMAYASHFWLSCAVMVGSILVKLYMFLYNRMLAEKLSTPTLKAVSMDSISDTIATTAVLISALVTHFVALPTWLKLDAICGMIVSLFILYSGCKSAKETIEPLLGKRPDPEFIKEIEEAVLSFEGIYGIHDVIVHDYGPGRIFISLHAEVPANADILETHDVIDNAEKYLSDRFSCSATIHMDPIQTDDPLTVSLKKQMVAYLKTVDPRLNLHDFRIVAGPTHTNLVFDVVLPYDLKLTESDMRERIANAAKELSPTYLTVVEFDRAYADADVGTQKGSKR